MEEKVREGDERVMTKDTQSLEVNICVKGRINQREGRHVGLVRSAAKGLA